MMSEPTGESPRVPFEKLSPISQNNTLRDFYRRSSELLPKISPFSVLDEGDSQGTEEKADVHQIIMRDINRRHDSEMTIKLSEKLQFLLQSANVTQAMKDFLIWEFRELFSLGDRNITPETKYEWLTKRGAGIFSNDMQTVKDIGRKAYFGLGEGIKAAGVTAGETLRKMQEIAKSAGVDYNPFDLPIDRVYTRWEGEFKERYGEDP